MIHEELPLRENELVVDFGCGEKPYLPLFEASGCKYFGCDIVEGADLIIQPGRPLALEDGCAAGLVSFQVLEHVWDLDWYFSNCHRILRKQGWLLLSTHGHWLFHAVPDDFRRWTRSGLVKELETRGFHVEKVVPVMGPLALTSQFRLLGLYHFLRGFGLLGKCIFYPISLILNGLMALEDGITPQAYQEQDAAIYILLARKAD